METQNVEKMLSNKERKEWEQKKSILDIKESKILKYMEEAYSRNDDEYEIPHQDPEEEYRNTPEWELSEIQEKKKEIKRVLYADDHFRKLTKYKTEYDQKVKVYSFGNILPDTSADISVDVFDRDILVKSISEMWFQPSTEGAINVGITGKWGSGKTTFMKSLKACISQHKDSEKLFIVDYDASEYEDTEKIWANFAKRLFEVYEKKVTLPKLKYIWAKINRDKNHYIEVVLVKLLVVIGALVSILLSKGLYSYNQLLGYATGIITGCGSLALAVTQLLIPCLKSSITATTPLSDSIIEKIKMPNYKDKLGTRAEISEELDILFEAWFKKEQHKVVLFVDELDRCSDKGIIEFFQSIQLLLNNNHINFVFATIDTDHLKKVFKNNYNLDDENVESYMNEFLEKYISFAVPLNTISDYDQYINSLVKQVKKEEATNSLFSDEIETIKKCIQGIDANLLSPRKVKKIINVLVLVKEFCVGKVNCRYAIDFNEFATWFIFATAYPKEAQSIIDKFKAGKEHFPLEDILSQGTIDKIVDKEKCKQYIENMKSYAMSDINLYNFITTYYSLDSVKYLV